MKKTQLEWVLKELDNGSVSRNNALNNRISRLGAYICSLNKLKKGKKRVWEIKGFFRDTKYGRKDYVYDVIKYNK